MRRKIKILVKISKYIGFCAILRLPEQIPEYALCQPASSAKGKDSHHPDTSQLTPVPPLAFFSVDPLPSLFAHTVPEIFSLWAIFTLQRKDIDPQSRMFVFSVLVQLIKQRIFICITQKKSGETAVILHRFQSSAQLWFFIKDIFKPGHITGLHINIIACRIHGKRALRYRTEGKIRRKIICDLIFSAYGIYFF